MSLWETEIKRWHPIISADVSSSSIHIELTLFYIISSSSFSLSITDHPIRTNASSPHRISLITHIYASSSSSLSSSSSSPPLPQLDFEARRASCHARIIREKKERLVWNEWWDPEADGWLLLLTSVLTFPPHDFMTFWRWSSFRIQDSRGFCCCVVLRGHTKETFPTSSFDCQKRTTVLTTDMIHATNYSLCFIQITQRYCKINQQMKTTDRNNLIIKRSMLKWPKWQ